MLYAAPQITDKTEALPVYLFTTGLHHFQEPRLRPKGFMYHHLFFVMEGDMLLRCEGEERILPAGTAVFLPKDLPMDYYAAGDRLISAWVTFGGTAVDALLSYFQVDGIAITDAAPLLSELEAIARAVQRGQSHEQLSALLYPLLLSFFTQYTAPRSNHLSVAQAFIRKHVQEDISVRDISDAVGISPSLLHRIFAQNGSSPLAFLLTARIDLARQNLLDNPDQSVAQVAEACGFHDCAYFCKVFRRQVGLTPNAYRKKFQ